MFLAGFGDYYKNPTSIPCAFKISMSAERQPLSNNFSELCGSFAEFCNCISRTEIVTIRLSEISRDVTALWKS